LAAATYTVLVGCGTARPDGPAGAPATSTRPDQVVRGVATTVPTPHGKPSATAGPVVAGRDGRRPTGRPVRLAFGGDVHFEGVSGQRLATDPTTAVGPLAEVLTRADLAMVNLESAITTGGVPVPKTYVFRAPPTALTALRSAGVDVATMANNHGLDYGEQGLHDSVRAARTAGFPVVGIGENDTEAYAPYRTVVNGQRIAVLGATQVIDDELVADWTAGQGKPGLASAKDVGRLLAAVRAARVGADTVVVYLHWGLERASCPTETQRSLVPALAEAGADVIVGSHAHVLLGSGWSPPDGVYVNYGLGNFVFYSSGDGPNTASGVLELTVHGRAVTAASWVPARLAGGAPQPLGGLDAFSATASWHALRDCTGLAAAPPPEPAGAAPARTSRPG
jgi:poly-gamma-glutamate synthesis protein (capsule biosynthesis protein)